MMNAKEYSPIEEKTEYVVLKPDIDKSNLMKSKKN